MSSKPPTAGSAASKAVDKQQQFKKPQSSDRSSKMQVNTSTSSSNAPSISGINATSNSIRGSAAMSSQSNMRPVLVQGIAGDGLWTQVKEEKYNAMAEKFVEKKAKQAESKVESAIVDMLEKECSDLGKQLEQTKAKVLEKSVEIAQMKRIIDQNSVNLQEQSSEIMNLRTSKRVLEEQLEKTRDGYNSLKRDMGKAHQDSSQEAQKASDLKTIYIELKKQYEEYKLTMNARVKDLEEKLEEMIEENEEIKGSLQIKQEIAQRVDFERMKQFQEKEVASVNESEKRIERMSKLLEENAVLTEKLAESESYRKKFKEKNVLLEKQVKQAVAEQEKSEAQCAQLKKRASDLTVLKSSNNKILDDRIKGLSKENDELTTENKNLKKQLAGLLKNRRNNPVEEDDDDDEQLEEIQAKPFLFGPIDNGKF